MSVVTVYVLKPLKHQGRSYVRGNRISVDAVQALAMSRRGEVSLTRGVIVALDPVTDRQALQAEAATNAAMPVNRRARRQYRRRDLQVETPSE